MKLLTKNKESVDDYLGVIHTNSPFNSRVKDFISTFSERILSSKKLRKYPDIIALGFWMRRKNIARLERNFNNKYSDRIPCGTVLHFAPSNVDTIFIYSLFVSLMLGNKNIVRVSSKNSDEKNLILEELNNTIDAGFTDILDYIMIVSYLHDDKITAFLSSKSNLRVIWGGDVAVDKISSYPLPSTSNEIKFANKYSLCMVKASQLACVSDDALEKLITNFANDIYWFGQQGCSSPRTIVWLNDIAEDALNALKHKFYQRVQGVAATKFSNEMGESDFINKTVACDVMAASIDESQIIEHNGHLTRFIVSNVGEHNIIKQSNCGSGLLLELNVSELDHIVSLIDRTTQTITYFGFDMMELKSFFNRVQIYPDRVVPVGRALDFSTTWDGYDLLVSMTRGVHYE
ncbi:MAG: acyl-CoA reductase [Shewanella sp.]